MSTRVRVIVAGSCVLAILLAAVYFFLPQRGQTPRAQLAVQAAAPSIHGFQRAVEPMDIEFPRDNGPHPEYQTEWWYYTGNLEADDGRHYGFQLTFFRRSLAPPSDLAERTSSWSTGQVYMAHLAISDSSQQAHHEFERLGRGAAGLAGAQADPYQVWLEDWGVEEIAPGVYHLHAGQDGYQVDLTLTDIKGPVLHGEQGLSRKGDQPGQASYYISQPRMAAQGEIRTPGQADAVSGSAWMDHEFSTSALAADQIGWDWFSLQLDDGSDLMLFQIRKADGSLDLSSSGTLISEDGTTIHLSQEDFSIEVTDHWKSPDSAAQYPAGWMLRLPEHGLTLRINPYFEDQEMNLSYNYWEGAVRAQGTLHDVPITGRGYVELTGYAGSMSGEF